MALTGVSYGTAWRALSRARSKEPNRVIPFGAARSAADAAAATDMLAVIRSPVPPRSAGRYKVSDTRPPAGYYRPPDEIELWCCTAEYTNGRLASMTGPAPCGWRPALSHVRCPAARSSKP